MKYYKVNFSIDVQEALLQDACDILSALAGEAGFETFEQTEKGITGYVQQALFDQNILEQQISTFPLPDSRITFEVSEAEDKDWNKQWEQQGFEPIIVSDSIAIHDGRHLPAHDYPCVIEIDARQAFGTGTHETTRMMVSTLLDLVLKDRRVLDCGTGTGILSIAALKLGAAEAIGYDIDEWSVDNARHNAVINRVDDRFKSLLGDASILYKEVKGTFDVVMANINRNILLADMPAFCEKMKEGSLLLLSGFYTSDINMLEEKALQLGLHKKAQQHDGDWACLFFSKG